MRVCFIPMICGLLNLGNIPVVHSVMLTQNSPHSTVLSWSISSSDCLIFYSHTVICKLQHADRAMTITVEGYKTEAILAGLVVNEFYECFIHSTLVDMVGTIVNVTLKSEKVIFSLNNGKFCGG